MTSEGKQEQEERPLNAIGDSFKKIIVVRDNIKVRRNDMGIVTVGIRNFLMDENSLNISIRFIGQKLFYDNNTRISIIT